MEPQAAKQTRNSRWTRDPVLHDGKPALAKLTERDLEVFKLLSRYRYLPIDDIHALIGGSDVHFSRRLDLLQRAPNLYLNRPHQQRANAEANYRKLIYELDDRGARVLKERDIPCPPKVYHRNFAHELMVCRITASIELGCRANTTLRLITWPDILAKAPEKTKTANRPERLPIQFDFNGTRLSTEAVADGMPFGIQRADQTYVFCPGIEADCGTEPIDTNDIERSSIYKKFLAYRAIVASDVHRTHWGIPNFFVPIITTNKTRMESMMQLLERVSDGKGSKIFLFKTFPAFTSFEKPPPATGHMLTEPWARVGFPPLNLSK